MRYQVKDIFRTLQGEGRWAGHPAIFVRLAGCNLWSGQEASRQDAVCKFCDTNFVGGKAMDKEEIASEVARLGNDWWGSARARRIIVITGGEPMLQLDYPLAEALRGLGARFKVHLETNGTKAVPDGLVDWITVSPKAGSPIEQRSGDELKVVVPQDEFPDIALVRMLTWGFGLYYLSPRWDPDSGKRDEYMDYAVSAVQRIPPYTLSLQTHKYLGIP